MLEAIQSYLPPEWQRTVEFLGAPLWWIPPWQDKVLGGLERVFPGCIAELR